MGRVVPEGIFEQFGGVFPESVLYLGVPGLTVFLGRGGRGSRMFSQAPVVDAWLGASSCPSSSAGTVVHLGWMLLWEISGPAVDIDVIGGGHLPNSRGLRERCCRPCHRERHGCIIFTSRLWMCMTMR